MVRIYEGAPRVMAARNASNGVRVLQWQWRRFSPLKSILFVLVVLTIAFYNETDIGMTFEDGEKDAVKKSVGTAKRIRFTQMWSTGHVGTKFLTGLLAAPAYYNKTYEPGYMVWNEAELPLLKPPQKIVFGKSIYDLSLYEFKAMMIKNSIPENVNGQNRFRRMGFKKGRGRKKKDVVVDDIWYGGLAVKKWNTDGNTAALRTYLEEKHVPALRSVYQRYNRGDPPRKHWPPEKLNHFIKVGHTAIFFDLSDYYEVFSSASLDGETTVDIDFVRIRRNRIEVANSFVADKNRLRPVEYSTKESGVVTNPAMKTALLRFSSLGGPLPDEIWKEWTIFQQYLWFCDEIEARWRTFLKKHPKVRHYELAYSDSSGGKQELSSSAIDDLAQNFLEINRPLSPYLSRISKQSHFSEYAKPKLTQKEREEQATEYSRQAPWCLQYEGESGEYEFGRLDCGIEA